MNPEQSTNVSTPHAAHGVAGAIILSLALVGALYFMGFRFMVAAGVGR